MLIPWNKNDHTFLDYLKLSPDVFDESNEEYLKLHNRLSF